NPIVLEPAIRYLWIDEVRMRHHQRWSVRHLRLHSRREVAGGEARALPVVMLPGRPLGLAVRPLYLLRAIEAPHFLAGKIELDERGRLLMRRAVAATCDHEPPGQDASRSSGDTDEPRPFLDLASVHVDHDDAFVLRRDEHGEAIPRLLGMVDRRSGRVHGR